MRLGKGVFFSSYDFAQQYGNFAILLCGCGISFSCILVTSCRGLLFCDIFMYCINPCKAVLFLFRRKVLAIIMQSFKLWEVRKKQISITRLQKEWDITGLCMSKVGCKLSVVTNECFFRFDRCNIVINYVYRYALFRNPNMVASLLFPLVAILSLIFGTRENRATVCEA